MTAERGHQRGERYIYFDPGSGLGGKFGLVGNTGAAVSVAGRELEAIAAAVAFDAEHDGLSRAQIAGRAT